jgi:hypothetical protein
MAEEWVKGGVPPDADGVNGDGGPQQGFEPCVGCIEVSSEGALGECCLGSEVVTLGN